MAPAESLTENVAATGDETGRLLARAQTALALVVPNAASAQYAEVRSGSGGAICGRVEAGAPGQLYPFVVLPGGNAMVSTGTELRLDDAVDPFPDLYMQYCASVEELRRLSERMSQSPGRIPPPDMPMPLPIPDDETVDRVPDEAPPPARPSARPSPPGNDDSFFNAIVRAPPEAAPRP